jgi:hypothetical protein
MRREGWLVMTGRLEGPRFFDEIGSELTWRHGE